ncbi:endolytic transglycosylase MltG [Paenibacillus gansuensis]|uniref:Endolytic murein transglycosylase n=1 Tax=Paenibacillus gansuensis TaxID=306542 RepID=A0ABW5PCL5_9BACL
MRRIQRFILLGIIVLAAVGAALFFYAKYQLNPVPAKSKSVQVTVKPGMSTSAISEELERKGLIRSSTVFALYLKYKNEGGKFQAGKYAFTPGATIQDIIERLNKGDTVKADTIRFTVPEGYTLRQIADKLSSEGYVERSSFLAAASRPAEIAPELAAYIPKEAVLKYPMEGYLFPETYEFAKGAKAAEILSRMASELESRLDQLPPDWESVIQARGQSLHDILTIASLVEREAIVDLERPIIAGVIYNRLDQKMRLQIDATVQYLLDKPKARLLYKDLKIESVYNTYLHEGLPPGPIASPSLASIKAAVYPEKSKFLFYVTKKDGTNTHFFAETYKQHLKNIEISNKLASE